MGTLPQNRETSSGRRVKGIFFTDCFSDLWENSEKLSNEFAIHTYCITTFSFVVTDMISRSSVRFSFKAMPMSDAGWPSGIVTCTVTPVQSSLQMTASFSWKPLLSGFFRYRFLDRNNLTRFYEFHNRVRVCPARLARKKPLSIGTGWFLIFTLLLWVWTAKAPNL